MMKGVLGILLIGLLELEERFMMVLAFDDGFFGYICICLIDRDQIG